MASHELNDFIASASKRIEEEYNRIIKRTKEDPGTAGDQGEENWATLLKEWLPSNFHIVIKGRILSEKGIASPQVDIIVLRPEYPKLLIDKKLYLAGGVLAIFECKTTFRMSHLKKFFSNAQKIKELFLNKGETPYSELHTGVLYGLLAHSYDVNGGISDINQKINNRLIEEQQKISHPRLLPDDICIANFNSWSLSRMTYMSYQMMSSFSKEKFISNYGHDEVTSIGFLGQKVSIENANQPLGAFLVSLLYKLSWEYVTLRPISRYFTLTNVQGSSSGSLITYKPQDIYSEKTLEQIRRGMIKSGKPWDKWGMHF